MGQRHQIYVFVKDDKGKIHGTAIHHQWLYGHTAGLQTVRMMEYQKKTSKDKYHPFNSLYCGDLSQTTDCLKAFYSLIPEQGYYHHTSYIGEKAQDKWEKDCVNDPRQGDNNDGITVFDFTDMKNPTYCMVNMYTQEKEYDSSCALPEKEPVSIEAYVRAYYPVGGSKYARERNDLKGIAQNEKHIAKIFKRAEKFKVMTLARAKTLMPGLYAAELSVREKAIAAAKAGKMI